MSPTETSLLGKESDSLWQLEGVPYRTSFSNLMSPATRRCVACLNYREKHRDPGATTQFPGTGWGIVREGVITSHKYPLPCTENLAPATKHFIIVFLSNLWGKLDLWFALSGLREEKGARRGKREENQQATEEAGVQLGLLATCQHGYFHWLSLAWWWSGCGFWLRIVLETPDRAVLRFSGNMENFSYLRTQRNSFIFPLFTHFLLTTRSHFVSQQPSSPPDPAISQPILLYKCVHGILFR